MEKNSLDPKIKTVNALIGWLLGIVSSFFVASILMSGVWAYFLAVSGNILTSIASRSARIVNNERKGIMFGLVIGYAMGVIVIGWAGTKMDLSANLWVMTVFVLTTGMTRIFISDDTLERWIRKQDS